MKDKILTIDVGTGSTRAAILRIDGAMIGFAQREYEQTTPRAGRAVSYTHLTLPTKLEV